MERAKIYPLNRNRVEGNAIANALASPPKPKLLDQVRQAIRARLIYGGGLRLLECCRLRVKDIDFSKTRLSFEQARAIKIAIRCFLARLARYIGTCKRGCVF